MKKSKKILKNTKNVKKYKINCPISHLEVFPDNSINTLQKKKKISLR